MLRFDRQKDVPTATENLCRMVQPLSQIRWICFPEIMLDNNVVCTHMEDHCRLICCFQKLKQCLFYYIT